MVDLVDLEEDGLDDVVPDHLEVGVAEVVHHVLLAAREEVVHHDHAVAARHQAVHQGAAHEAGAAGDEDAQALPLEPQGHLSGHELAARVVRGGVDGEAGESSVDASGGGLGRGGAGSVDRG